MHDGEVVTGEASAIAGLDSGGNVGRFVSGDQSPPALRLTVSRKARSLRARKAVRRPTVSGSVTNPLALRSGTADCVDRAAPSLEAVPSASAPESSNKISQ